MNLSCDYYKTDHILLHVSFILHLSTREQKFRHIC